LRAPGFELGRPRSWRTIPGSIGPGRAGSSSWAASLRRLRILLRWLRGMSVLESEMPDASGSVSQFRQRATAPSSRGGESALAADGSCGTTLSGPWPAPVAVALRRISSDSGTSYCRCFKAGSLARLTQQKRTSPQPPPARMQTVNPKSGGSEGFCDGSCDGRVAGRKPASAAGSGARTDGWTGRRAPSQRTRPLQPKRNSSFSRE
jgi:hypothetical protein